MVATAHAASDTAWLQAQLANKTGLPGVGAGHGGDSKTLTRWRKCLAAVIYARCGQPVALANTSQALTPKAFLQALKQCQLDSAKAATMQQTLAYLDGCVRTSVCMGTPQLQPRGSAPQTI